MRTPKSYRGKNIKRYNITTNYKSDDRNCFFADYEVSVIIRAAMK